MKTDEHFKYFSLSLIWCWLILFALLPTGLVFLTSFMMPHETDLSLSLTLINYQQILQSLYFRIFQKSFFIAGSATLICLVLAYPFAYLLSRLEGRLKNILLLLIIIPFWTSSLIRSYALIAVIKAKGLLNAFLISVGLIQQPLSLLFTNYAVMIGLVYNLLPFMILPILTNIERLDVRLVDAARDLGANRFTTFTRIIIPLTLPGIIAGSILVFLPAMTIFYIPDILGGAKSILLGNLIQNQYLVAQNWPMGSALSTTLTLILALLIIVYLSATHGNKKKNWM